MDGLQEQVQRLRNLSMTNPKSLQEHLDSNSQEIECKLCNDSGFIKIIDPKVYHVNGCEPLDLGDKIKIQTVVRECTCLEGKKYRKILENSGISETFRLKTLNEYKPKNNQQQQAKKLAMDYILEFNSIRITQENGIGFLCQVGSGKTHLIVAIANALLKQNIGVLYMQYREVITQLKQVIRDEEVYQQQLRKYKNAPVLIIDDLFKGILRNGVANESEMSIMFEIFDFRYFKKLPVIISCEHGIDNLIDLDEAIGSRIAHICKGRIIEFVGTELNHRMI